MAFSFVVATCITLSMGMALGTATLEINDWARMIDVFGPNDEWQRKARMVDEITEDEIALHELIEPGLTLNDEGRIVSIEMNGSVSSQSATGEIRDISKLPRKLSKLMVKNWIVFSLDLRVLPEGLEVLAMINCRLSEVNMIGAPTGLHTINFDNNYLQEIELKFAPPNLKYLRLNNNLLSYVGFDGVPTALRQICMKDNPFLEFDCEQIRDCDGKVITSAILSNDGTLGFLSKPPGSLSSLPSMIIVINQEKQSRGRARRDPRIPGFSVESVAPPQIEVPENPLKDSFRTFPGGIAAVGRISRGIRLSRGRSGVSRLVTN